MRASIANSYHAYSENLSVFFYCIHLTDVILIEGTICGRVGRSIYGSTDGSRGTVHSAMDDPREPPAVVTDGPGGPII